MAVSKKSETSMAKAAWRRRINNGSAAIAKQQAINNGGNGVAAAASAGGAASAINLQLSRRQRAKSGVSWHEEGEGSNGGVRRQMAKAWQ